MKRRVFLKKTLLAAPAALVAASLLQGCGSNFNKPGEGLKVIVIGAGIAGIYAAHLLSQLGFEVEILEASPRWGGRIRSLEGFAAFDVELGAEFVHGQKSDWYQLVKNSGATLVDDADDPVYYRLDNAIKTDAQTQADPDAKKAFLFLRQIDSFVGDDKTVKAEADFRGIAARVRHIVNAQTGNEWGTSYTRLGIAGIAEEENLWTAGNLDFLVTGTSYAKIIEQNFAETLAKITFDTPAQSIDYQTEKVSVTDRAGQKHMGDYVVVAVPLTALKDGDISFTPALPSRKTAALKKFGMGAGMKIVLKFDTAFWPNGMGYLYGTGVVPLYWQTSLHRGGGATPMLSAFVMGENAEYLSSLSESDAIKAVLADLDEMYSGKATANYVEAKIMDWTKEPFVRGAYSFPMVGGSAEMRARLAEPLQGKVFFIGEATCANGHNSTVHGAMETAMRVVDEILG